MAWESTLRVAPGGVDSTKGIPFAFELPDTVREAAEPHDPNAPSVQFKAVVNVPFVRRRIVSNTAPSATLWRLVVSAPMSGTDFQAAFDVPVK